MDDFISISLLSLAMLVGCYVAGTIPLAVNFSEVIFIHHCIMFHFIDHTTNRTKLINTSILKL